MPKDMKEWSYSSTRRPTHIFGYSTNPLHSYLYFHSEYLLLKIFILTVTNPRCNITYI